MKTKFHTKLKYFKKKIEICIKIKIYKKFNQFLKKMSNKHKKNRKLRKN